MLPRRQPHDPRMSNTVTPSRRPSLPESSGPGRAFTIAPGPSESFQIPSRPPRSTRRRSCPRFFAQWAPMLCQAAGVGARPARARRRLRDRHRRPHRRRPRRPGRHGRRASTSTRRCSPWRRRVRPDIEWRQGDAAALPFADDSFDAVLSPDGADVLPRPRRAVREMARVVRPGRHRRRARAGRARRPAGLRPVRRRSPPATPAPRPVSLLSTYFVCGDLDELAGARRVGRAAGDDRPHRGRHLPGAVGRRRSSPPRWRARRSSSG